MVQDCVDNITNPQRAFFTCLPIIPTSLQNVSSIKAGILPILFTSVSQVTRIVLNT